jgi:hypothetical protein
MVAAFGGALILTAVVFATFGAGEKGTTAALRVTARWSFLLFWLAYSGGPMAMLFGPAFQPLAGRVREFGLAFASAHLVHVALVAWLCWIGHGPGFSTFLFFGTALFWTYLLAVCSISRARDRLGRSGWWLVRTVGTNYILYAFAVDFFAPKFQGTLKYIVAYLIFVILVGAGPLLRIAALGLRVGDRWRGAFYRIG